MSDSRIFQEALSNFTYDTASGGAIRHLADLGYSASEIEKQIDYPTPFMRIQKTVWEHFLNTGQILLKKPGEDVSYETVSYVKETGKYGRSTFRRIVQKTSIANEAEVLAMSFDRYLEFAKTEDRTIGDLYFTCTFGAQKRADAKAYEKLSESLTEKESDYLFGLLWEEDTVYYRADERMRMILTKLYNAGLYREECYFIRRK